MISKNEIFSISNDLEFERIALKIFQYQYSNCSIYNAYCNSINRTSPKNIREIPFLPIQFFKTHEVVDATQQSELLFKSSGTGGNRSKHFVTDKSIYEQSFTTFFKSLFDNLENVIILAVLPNYIEQGESSLIYMVDSLIKQTTDPFSNFIEADETIITDYLQKSKNSGKEVVLFSVAFALMNLNNKKLDFSNVTLIETGGMKGRQKELSKEEFHEELKNRFNPKSIISEYGMTELLSQAYAVDSLAFNTPNWMKVLIRETNDPFSFTNEGKTGGINIIDLANIHSCSFIATQDLGKLTKEGFEIIGRFDHSDIRGCNLLMQ